MEKHPCAPLESNPLATTTSQPQKTPSSPIPSRPKGMALNKKSESQAKISQPSVILPSAPILISYLPTFSCVTPQACSQPSRTHRSRTASYPGNRGISSLPCALTPWPLMLLGSTRGLGRIRSKGTILDQCSWHPGPFLHQSHTSRQTCT